MSTMKKYKKIKDGRFYNTWNIGDIAEFFFNPDPEYWELIEEPQCNCTKNNSKDRYHDVGCALVEDQEIVEPQDLPGNQQNTQNKKIQVEESGEIAITKKNAIGNMHFLRMMTSHRNSDWEKAYDELLNYIESPQPTTSSKEWEEAEKIFIMKYGADCGVHEIGYVCNNPFCNDKELRNDVLSYFRPHFISLQQRAEKAEQRIKELESEIKAPSEEKRMIRIMKNKIKELEEVHAKENCIHMEETGKLLKRIEELEKEIKSLDNQIESEFYHESC